jgi:hypothetical protein
MAKFSELEVGAIALVQKHESGRIIQIGLTKEQSRLLQIFLATLSQESKLIQMPEDYDLVLKGAILELTLEDAEQLSQTCDYALLAVQTEGNEINWGDASSFFLEGYEYARRSLA